MFIRISLFLPHERVGRNDPKTVFRKPCGPWPVAGAIKKAGLPTAGSPDHLFVTFPRLHDFVSRETFFGRFSSDVRNAEAFSVSCHPTQGMQFRLLQKGARLWCFLHSRSALSVQETKVWNDRISLIRLVRKLPDPHPVAGTIKKNRTSDCGKSGSPFRCFSKVLRFCFT